MSVILKYKARMSYSQDGCYSKDVLCNVLHEVDYAEDGTWKTINLDWEPYPEEPKER